MDVYKPTIMGFAAMFVLGRPGEAVRPLLLARKCHLPVASMFGIWAIERIFDFGAAVALATLSLLVFTRELSDAGANTDWLASARPGGWLLLATLAGVIGVLVYFRLHGASTLDRLMKRWQQKSGWRQRITGFICGFSEGLQAIRTPSDMLMATAYSAVHWALVALAYLCISQAFSSEFALSNMNFPGAMLLLAVTLVGAAAIAGGRRGRAGGQFYCPDLHLWGRAGTGGGHGLPAVADHLRQFHHRGPPAADPRRTFDGRVAPPGKRGRAGRVQRHAYF
jgi:hypothetical protein